jgi:nucleoside 2-deoxyribosyltransferase
VWEEDEYLARDRAIVDNTDLLIGCPRGYDLRSHGGTAYTVRYALSKGKPVVIIWADGSVELKNLPAGEAGEAGDMDTEEMWKKPGKETTRNA